MEHPARNAIAYRNLRRLLVVAGLLVSLWMVGRAQVAKDQLEVLLLAWGFWSDGIPRAYGNGLSGGGLYPGPSISILHGLPLHLFRDYRAIGMAVLVSHLVAYLLLDRTLRSVLSARERLFFCILYWWSPWRLHFSAHIWNPNWLFIVGAVHFVTAYRQRSRASPLASLVHVLALGLGFQLHASTVLLAVASALLWVRRRIRLSWLGVSCGGAIIVASLVPYLLAATEHPEILPVAGGSIGKSVLHVHSVLRGVAYWLRYSSLALGRRMIDFDFEPAFGQAADAVLAPLATGLVVILGAFTLVAALLANVSLWRRERPANAPVHPDRRWLLAYVRISFVAGVATFAISPTTIMMWQVLGLFHAAVVPTVVWLERLRRPERTTRVVLATAGLMLLVTLAIAIAAPMYRRGVSPACACRSVSRTRR